MLYYITLYYIISYYSCYILLYYNTLHYIMLYYIILYCIMLYYIILYYQPRSSVNSSNSSFPPNRSHFVGYDIFSSIIFDHNISSQFNILHKSSQYFPDVSWYSYMSCPRSTHFTWIHPRSGSARARLRHPGPISGSFIRNFFRAPKAAPGMMACLDRYFRWKMSLRTVKDVSNICFEHGKSL